MTGDFFVFKKGEIVILVPQFTELEGANAAKMKTAISELIQENNHKIVIDFINVIFVDSSGLGSLVAGLKNAHSNNSNLVFCNIAANIHSLLELTRLVRVFKIVNNADEALNSFEQKIV
jgi:anti-sigma B factor antagonist